VLKKRVKSKATTLRYRNQKDKPSPYCRISLEEGWVERSGDAQLAR